MKYIDLKRFEAAAYQQSTASALPERLACGNHVLQLQLDVCDSLCTATFVRNVLICIMLQKCPTIL